MLAHKPTTKLQATCRWSASRCKYRIDMDQLGIWFLNIMFVLGGCCSICYTSQSMPPIPPPPSPRLLTALLLFLCISAVFGKCHEAFSFAPSLVAINEMRYFLIYRWTASLSEPTAKRHQSALQTNNLISSIRGAVRPTLDRNGGAIEGSTL